MSKIHAPRIKSFDGLKGFSIMMVIFYHLFPQWFPGGFLMVNAFLVLAGFFFAHKMEKILGQDQKNISKPLLTYLKSTVERVVLPLIWMLMIIVIGYLLFDPKELHYIRNELLSSTFLVNNWYQIMADRSYFVKMTSATPFTHLWYNSIYIQSFLLAIPLFLLTRKLKMSLPAKGIFWLVIVGISHLLMFVLYIPGADPSRVYYGLDLRFSSFALGLATAYSLPVVLNYMHGMKNRQKVFSVLGTLLTFITFIFIGLVDDQNDKTYLLWMSFFNMICMGLIWLITINPPFIRIFWGNRLFQYLGQRSYSYYLWYFPVIIFCMGQFRLFNGNMTLINGLSLAGILLIGELFYQIVEQAKIFIPYGNRLRNKAVGKEGNWLPLKWRNAQTYRWGQAILAVGLLAFAFGLITARNDKRVALMELEYQTHRFAPNMLKEPFPAEGPIIKVKDKVHALDQAGNTALTGHYDFGDPVKNMLSNYRTTKSNERIIQQLVNMKFEEIQAYLAKLEEYKQEVAELENQHPIVTDELSEDELLFAAQVPMTLFGDSIVNINGINTMEVFKNSNYYGEGSLQIWDAIPIYQQMLDEGDVQDNVVINLGTNASLDRESLDTVIEMSGDRQVFFINTNSKVQHIEEVNKLIKEVAKAYPNVHEVDWHSYQKGHPDWYGEDEIHHSVEGMEHFTIIIAKTMYKVLANQN